MAENITFQNPNPAIGKQGTLVTAQWFQNTQDEIANVITDNGGQIDPTKSNQLSQTLTTKFAPLNSPTFTGSPLVPDTNSTSNGKQIVNFESMQAYVNAGTLGYTPVHQGGGTGQNNSTIYIGWASDNSGLKATVDSTDQGVFAFQGWCNQTFLSLTGGNINGSLTVKGTTVATINDVNNAETDVKNWSNSTFQLKGDYATNTTVNNYVTSLQNQINNRVQKTGDTMSGTLTIEGETEGVITQYNPGSPSSGTYVNYPGFISTAEGRGGQFYMQLQEEVGTKFTGLFSLRDGSGNWRYVGIPTGNRINDSAYGDVAYVNDLSSYVPTSTYSNDFNTADSRIINLAYGHRIQFFTITVDGNGTNSHRITYPQAFSGASTVTFNGNDTGQSRSVSLAQNTTPDSTGFNIAVSVHGNSTAGSTDGLTLTVIAIGPK